MKLRDAGSVVVDRGYQLVEQTAHFFRRDSAERLAGGVRQPVLLLPGVYETWQFLRPVGELLHRRGHPVFVVPGFGYNRGAIETSAELAQGHLDRLDLRGVILVGHSKGGIIGKHMMVTDDVSGRIDRMIAINSPFGGSTLARFAPTQTLRMFAPTDQLLQTLGANLAANARIVSVYSRLDPLIPAGSRLEGAVNVELPLVGHFRPLGSPLLFSVVEAALGEVSGPEGSGGSEDSAGPRG